jgi:hypothetical protein
MSQKISAVATGDRIAYTQRFLKQIRADRDTAQRRGRVVATTGQTFDGVTHWKTGALLPVGAEFVLVQWEDVQYPRVYDDGESCTADLVRAEHVCRTRAAAFADTW